MSCEFISDEKGELKMIACGVNRNELGMKVDPSKIVFDSEDMTMVKVYVGLLEEKCVEPKWSKIKTAYQEDVGVYDYQEDVTVYEYKELSLKDIEEQFRDYGYITVWCEGPMSGTIYNWGNTLEGDWRVRGYLAGYA